MIKNHGITKETLKWLYLERGRSDSEIAHFFGLDRSTISRIRRENGIKARENLGHLGERIAIEVLKMNGFNVEDMNKKSKTSIYDLLINNNFKVEVKTTMNVNEKFIFTIRSNQYTECVESEYKIKLKNGSYRKLYRKTCDFLLLVGMTKYGNDFFVIPSDFIEDNKQNITIPVSKKSKSKYNQFRNNWELLKSE